MIFQKELLESLAANGEKIAVESASRRVSYAELLHASNRITAFLLARGLEKETPVGILLADGCDLLGAVIGVLNARGAFVPLNGALPAERLRLMAEDLRLQYLITTRGAAGADAVSTHPGVRVYFIEDIMDRAGAADPGPIQYPAYEEADSIYVYYTSGSSGTPKGIVGKNSSLLHFIRWEIDAFGINGSSRFSQLISPYFDAYLRDVFVPLLAGGTICLPPADEDFFSPQKLSSWIEASRVSVVHCVPSLFRLLANGPLTNASFPHLEHVLLSGEKIMPAELVNWYDLFGARIQLVNLYGPTETTMIKSCYLIGPQDAKATRIPIGAPISDTQLLILNKEGKPCKALIPGDLYIVTQYMTKGYLNNPGLTAEKFVTLNAGTPGEKNAFKTGDRARLMANGEIDLLGREDRQVKLRGVRIELDEIEAILVRSELVTQAAVVVHTHGNGDESLVAFVIGNDRTAPPRSLPDALRHYLAAHLPANMIPADLVEVHQYPLLSNGKINYRELYKLLDAPAVVLPANPLEARVLALWQEILGDKPVSTEESFHKVGGNSLSMMRLIAMLYQAFNVRVTLSELFGNLTIRKQARLIENARRDDLMTIARAGTKPAYNVSSAQERIYYTYALDPGSTAYNVPMALEVKGEITDEAIEAVLRQLIGRHEGLRTQFLVEDGKVMQRVKDAVPFSLEAFRVGDQAVPGAIGEFIRPFDLGQAPLCRGAMIRTGRGRRILVLDFHHIICDGMSQKILFADLAKLYAGEALPPLPVQYKDYAEWEYDFKATAEYTAHREFWLRSFEGEIPVLALPTLHAAGLSGEGGSVAFAIDRKTLQPLLDHLHREDITPFAGLAAVYFVFLSQLSGQEDIVVGIDSSGRIQQELEGVAGMFVKTLPIRYRIDADLPFGDFVAGLHQYLVRANSRHIYDLSDIMAELNQSRPARVKSLFDAVFSFQNFWDKTRPGAGTAFSAYHFEKTSAKYPIALFAQESEDAFNFKFEYARELFTQADMEVLAAQFKSLARQLSENPGAAIIDAIGHAEGASPATEDDILFNL